MAPAESQLLALLSYYSQVFGVEGGSEVGLDKHKACLVLPRFQIISRSSFCKYVISNIYLDIIYVKYLAKAMYLRKAQLTCNLKWREYNL
jgi:hypothetical protein